MNDLGTTYALGKSFERVNSNPALAVTVWLLAAERGSGWAMYNLAIHDTQPGADQDKGVALYWARKAVDAASDGNDPRLLTKANALVDQLPK